MLKLTTNKHEATRGLSATAELLVCYVLVYCIILASRYVFIIMIMYLN